MSKRTFVFAAAFAAAAATGSAGITGSAQADELRVGFINTLTGAGAVVGRHQLNGFMMGLEHEGWEKDGDRLGGVPMKLVVGDDQMRPDIGNQVAQRMVRSDDVHVVAGIFYSNILMAAVRPVVQAERVMFTTHAGAGPMAGAQCSRYFVASSFNNDQFAESVGQAMTKEGVKSVYLLAPNYQAGKDMAAGFERFYEGGKVVGQTFYKLGTTDFQAEIARIRAARPEGVFLFSFGAMTVAFMKQWEASGLANDVKLFPVAALDGANLPAIGSAAVGATLTSWWNDDFDNEANKRFVSEYRKKHDVTPPFYAANSYDGARLLAATMRAQGKVPENGLAFSKALRNTAFDSVRGEYKYNVNGVPIQNWYRIEVVEGDGGNPALVTREKVFDMQKDSYWEQCPEAERM